jgi:NADPH-dependent glutamate synthase beta subunit-like oxidoreductase
MGYGDFLNPIPSGRIFTQNSEYRLPPSILDQEISDIQARGVEIKTSCCVGRDIPFGELKSFQAVFVATGAHRGRALKMEGDNLKGVFSGLDLLKRIRMGERPSLGGKAIVIGGGNVAIDVSGQPPPGVKNVRFIIGERRRKCLPSQRWKRTLEGDPFPHFSHSDPWKRRKGGWCGVHEDGLGRTG